MHWSIRAWQLYQTEVSVVARASERGAWEFTALGFEKESVVHWDGLNLFRGWRLFVVFESFVDKCILGGYLQY